MLHLSEPSTPLLARLAELRILPARVINQLNHGTEKVNRCPIASGPFQLQNWESGLELVFRPNPNYWGAPPKCKELVWRIVPDKTLLGIALRRGELDVAPVDPLNFQATSLAGKPFSPQEREREQAKTRNEEVALDIEQFNGTRTVYLGFNVHRSPFDQALVRQAICTSINRTELAKVLFAGYAAVPLSDVSADAWYYNQTVREWPFDRQLSFRLLQRAGYSYSNGGWNKAGCAHQLAFRILTVRDFQDIGQVISNDLWQIGVPTEVQILEYTTLRAKHLKTGDYDVFLWSRSAVTDPDCSMVWGTGGPLNFVKLSDPAIDNLIARGRKALNRPDRALLYGKIQQILGEKLPWVFLVQPKLLIVHNRNIHNIKQANQEMTGLPWDNPLFNAPRWERRNRE